MITVILSAASSALAGDEQDCFQSQDSQLRITSCSGIIRRSPDESTAYHNRAVAYELAGDLDHAIADYSKVIALAPSNASAYANRGRAYASKGDHIRARDDATKARELIAKATTELATAMPGAGGTTRAISATASRLTTVRKEKKISNTTNKTHQERQADSWSSGNSPIMGVRN